MNPITLRLALAVLVASAGLALPAMGQKTVAPPAVAAPIVAGPSIQLAILLDTSGSMSGLIDQAKTQIWSIVNEMTKARMEGRRPHLRVALYEYGKSTIPASEQYLRQILPLTDDLDEVSSQFFALTTNGGEEYCGHVISAATTGLEWTTSPADLRLVVIAGNEPFTQGDLDYRVAVQAAVKRGLIINTIHCGSESVGADTGWKDGALLGEGTYSFIDHNAAAVHVEAPQDAEIARLGTELNTTYLAYGRLGESNRKRQQEQDVNAVTAGSGAAAQRAITKSGYAYTNSAWDLVDGIKDGSVKLEDMKDEDLPENMRGKTIEEKRKILDDAAAERAAIQEKIGKLNAERTAYVQAKLAELGNDNTLGAALIASLRQQAEQKGYVFGSK